MARVQGERSMSDIGWWIVLIGSSIGLVILVPYMIILFADEIPRRPTVIVYQVPNNTPKLKAAKLTNAEYRRILRENKNAVRRNTAFW